MKPPPRRHHGDESGRLPAHHFGRNPELPLRLDDRGEQNDARGVFRVEATDEGDLDVHRDGSVLYRLEQRPRELADFEAAHWYKRDEQVLAAYRKYFDLDLDRVPTPPILSPFGSPTTPSAAADKS